VRQDSISTPRKYYYVIVETEDGDDGSSEELWQRTERDKDGTEGHGGSSSSCGSGELLRLEATMCAAHANSDKFL